MARIKTTPSPAVFSETWAQELKAAVTTASGKDARLSRNEAWSLTKSLGEARLYGDNASGYLFATGKQSVSPEVLARDAQAYALRSAQVAAGPDNKLSLEDGKKLPKDLVDDFFVLRGKAEVPAPVAPQGPSEAALALKARFETAVEGMLTPSETDARFAVVLGPQLDGAPITSTLIRNELADEHDAVLGNLMWVDPSRLPLRTRTTVEGRDGLQWLQRIVDNADPQDEVSMANAQRFAALKALVQETLTDVQLFRFGDTSKSVFLAGRTQSGELMALLTGQVET